MKRAWLLGLILLSVLMAGCSFGGPSTSKQPPAGTYGDLAVTVYREGATALTPLWQKLFPKAYAEDGERRGIRVAVSHREPYVQVSRDVEATGDVFSVSMRVPARFGYRLSALEYVEVWGPSGKFFKVLSWGSQYPVDVDANARVAASIRIRSLDKAGVNPVLEVYDYTAEGGDYITGSLSVPTDFELGGFYAVAMTDDQVCLRSAERAGSEYEQKDGTFYARWRIPVPVFDHVEQVTCEFVFITEVLDARPGGFGREDDPYLYLQFPDDPIQVTFRAPGGHVGF